MTIVWGVPAMSINLASRQSAITTDFTGVNHIVWVENNALWHAQFDANAGIWVNARRVVNDVPGNVTALNLVANEKLINGSSPGLAVIWQQGDDRQNSSNFYYSAAQYGPNGQLQWDATPTVLTVNEATNSQSFTNLNPRAIADNNGNITIVGQQVSIANATNQAIREDVDLYTSFLAVPSVTPADAPAPAAAFYNPPVIVNGVNQGPGTPLNQSPTTAIVPQTAFTALDSTTVDGTASFVSTASSSNNTESQRLGFKYGPSLSFSTSLVESLGLTQYLSGIPRKTVENALKKYEIEGTFSGVVAPGQGLQLVSRGRAVDITQKKKVDNLTSLFDVDKNEYEQNVSFFYLSKTSFQNSSPYDLTAVADLFSLTLVETLVLERPYGQVTFSLNAGLGASLTLKPQTPDGNENILDVVLEQAGIDGATVLATSFANYFLGNQGGNLAGLLVADAVFAPIENLLLDQFLDVDDWDITFFMGPTIGGTVTGRLGERFLNVNASGGVSLLFGFGSGGEETTFLGIPVSAGVKVGPLEFDLSIFPKWSWPSSPPDLSSANNTPAPTLNAVSTSSFASFAALTSTTPAPTATVAGSLLTLSFDAPLDTTAVPNASDFTLKTQSIDQSQPVTATVHNVIVSNDPTTGNGVVVLQLTEPIAYSPQFTGTNPQSAGDMAINLSYTGTTLEFSDNTAVAGFTDLGVTNQSPQSLAIAFNPTRGNGNIYTTENQTALLGSLEADYAEDGTPALTLVTNSNSGDTQGQILAVWSREVQNLTPITGIVSGNEVYLNFVQDLDTSTTPSNSQFTVTVNGNSNTLTVTNVAIATGGYVQLNLSGTVQSSDVVSVTYQPSPTSQSNNLFLTDAVNTKLWLPTFTQALTNSTGKDPSAAPTLLGGTAIVGSGTTNFITLVFDALLDSDKIPDGSAFTVVNNGQTYNQGINAVSVAGNTVTFKLETSAGSSLIIGQGDIPTVTYTAGSVSDQNLTGSGPNGIAVGNFAQTLTTLPSKPTTTMMAGFYNPGVSGLANFQNIPGTDGFNLDPGVASDTNGNALAVWVYANNSDINNLTIPGSFYTDDQSQIILDNLNQSDIYFSYWNGSQWSLAAPLAIDQPGTDKNVTVAYDSKTGQYIAAWLNIQENATTGNDQVTVYWASYDLDSNTWSSINPVLSEATPDPLTDLVISSVNGQPALFWTETQPIAYAQLTSEKNPYLYLRLGELEGTRARNIGTWGAAANGTYNGTFSLDETGALFNPSTQTGDRNRAVLFSNGGSVSLDSTLNVGNSAFSVEFWFKTPSSPSNDTNLVSLDGVFSTSLGQDSNGNTTLTFNLANSSAIATSAINTPLSNNTWYYVVGTYSNQTQELSLYVNSQWVQTLDNLNVSFSNNAPLTIAGGSDPVYLDEIAIYGTALSYSNAPTALKDMTGVDFIDSLLGTNVIGEKYAAQYVAPLPPGPQTRYSLLDPTSNAWSSQSKITPLPLLQPTQLSNANTPTWDVVANTSPNSTGNIFPNGQEDTIFSTTINGFQGKTIESLTLTLSNGETYSVGGNSSDYQLGVVIGDSLINSPAPNAPFNYAVRGASLTLNLLVDTGSDPSANVTASRFTITFTDGSSASNTTTGSEQINLPQFVPPNSVPVMPGNGPIWGTATVTETEDSSLALIDSGFIINTTNPGMGYTVISADFNGDGQSDVAVGNRGYTNSNGTIENNGTVQILLGGKGGPLNTSSSALAPPTSGDSSASTSGDVGGFSLVGIPDGGQANGDFPLSMATGDVNNDGHIDLVIGSPNNSTVYVIYGSYLASTSPSTVIDVTQLTSSQGYRLVSPNGATSGDLFGFAVTVGNFNGSGGADIAIGTPNASNGQGEVFVAYNGSSSATRFYTGTSYTNPTTQAIIGEQAGYALATSAYVSGGAKTFSGSSTYDDLIVGAPSHVLEVNNSWTGSSGLPSNNPNPFQASTPVEVGAVYVFTGSASGLNDSPSYIYQGTDANTPSANGAAQPLFAGSALASNGDWNGDGYLDLAIAAPGGNDNDGVVYVLSGKDISTSGTTQYLNQVSNLTLNGGLPLGQAGTVVTSAGDVNDDGYADLLITAPQGANGTGQGYVIFGESGLLGSAGTTFLNLSPIASDSKTTFLLNGNFPYQLTGQGAAAVGDINGDGVDDLMITAPNANQLYAVYGHPWLADDGSVKLANISGDNGFVIDGDLYTVTNNNFPTFTEANSDTLANYSPTIIINQGTVYLGYAGANGGINLLTSNDNGQTWSEAIVAVPQSDAPNSSPVLAFFNGILYLAYQREETGGGLYITSSTDNGSTWTTPYQIGNFGIEYAPSLVVYQNQLVAFFINSTNSDIQYVFAGANGSSPVTSQNWSEVYTVANPDSTSYPNQTASGFVSATTFNDALYLAYAGGTAGNVDSNNFVTSTTGTTLSDLTWEVTNLGDLSVNSSNSLSITADNTSLYFGYANTSLEIQYLTSTNGTSWSEATTVPNQFTSNSPALTTLNDGGLLIAYASISSLFDIASIYVTSNLVALTGTGKNVVMLGDINGDGFADIGAGGSTYGAVITFGASTQDLLDGAAGTDELVVTISNSGTIINIVALGDFNGDGLNDFGVIDGDNNFYLVLGSPSLGAQQTLSLSINSQPFVPIITNAVALGDFNGDGYDDIILTSSDGNQILYKGNSLGVLDSSTTETVNTSNTVFNGTGDVNGDGFADVGGGNPNANIINNNRLGNGQATVFYGDTSANFGHTVPLNAPSAPISGDLVNSDWGFYTSRSDSDSLNPTLEGQSTLNGLAFTVYNGYLYMAYVASDDNTLWVQRSADGYNWEGETNFGSDFETYEFGSFSLAVFKDTLYVAFTATDNNIVVTPATSDSSQPLGLTFDSNNRVDVGHTSDYGPALQVYQDELYLFYAAKDSSLTADYVTSSDGQTWSGNSTITNSAGTAQESQGQLGTTVDGQGNLRVVFASNLGNETSVSFNLATYDGSAWSSQVIPNQSTIAGVGPGIVSVDDTLYVFFRSSDDTPEILYITSTDGGNTWSSPSVSIPGQTMAGNGLSDAVVLFQESILVGFAGTGTSQAINVSVSNPIYEANQTQQFGAQLQPIGDFNGDGIADFAVLAPGFFSNLGSINDNLLENNQGALFIYYGSLDGIAADATPDVAIAVPAPNPSTNVSQNQAILLSQFASVGDINGDGYDDLIIASPNTALNSNNTTDGTNFVIFGGGDSLWGNTYPATQPFDLGKLTPNTSRLTLYFSTPLNTGNLPAASAFSVTNGANTIAVESVSSDNPNELTLNLASNVSTNNFFSITYTQPSSGTILTYATGTKVATFTASTDAVVATLGAPTIAIETYPQFGFQITGLKGSGSQAGISVSGGGDVNGDGFSDLVIGAPGNNDNLTYVIFGSDFLNTVNQTGTIGDDVMVGTPTGESFVAGQGDDIIYTGGGADVVYAGPGNDLVTVHDTYFRRLDGGPGTDVLQFMGYNGQDWDLTTLSPGLRLRNFEVLDTRGYGANTLTLNSLTVTRLSPTNTVTVFLDDQDNLVLSPDFSFAGIVYQYDQDFRQYTSNQSAATVLVSTNGNLNKTPYLTLTEQGGLVLSSASGEVLWSATDSNGAIITGAVQALMQTDGNFVLYSKEQNIDEPGSSADALWASNTVGNAGAYLQLDTNGGLYIIGPNGNILSTLNPGSSTASNSVFQLTEKNQILPGQSLGGPGPTFTAPITNSPQPIFPTGSNAQTLAITGLPETSFAVEPNFDDLLAEVEAETTNSSGLPTQIYVSNPMVSERTGRADFTLTRTGDLNQYVWVDYFTQDGNGKAGDRYTPTAGRTVFTPGETTKIVTVPIPNNGKYVGDRQFSLAVTLEGETIDPALVPDAFEFKMTPVNEQIRRWQAIAGENGDSVLFDITTRNSPDGIVTLDLLLDGTALPLIWNPASQSYQGLPYGGPNGIQQEIDLNGNGIPNAYRFTLQDGGPFDNDGIINGLIAVDFNLAFLTPIEVPSGGAVVVGTAANNLINAAGKTGNYRLEGLDGMDVLIGSDQRDILLGRDGNDQLFGNGGTDFLYGGAGDDILDGGPGMDFLYGGPGADSFVLRAGDGPDRVMDFNAAEGDLFLLDQISFGALSFAGNTISLGAELLATVTDHIGNPVTDLADNPQWFVSL